MATYVLVHGGGHGGWCYSRVARLLRARGHEVHAPSLSGCGERAHLVTPAVDLDMHIRDVVAYLHAEDLREVVLVGHSYGGMVVTGAADRAPDRVGRLVYLDAANPSDGQSLLDVAGPVIGASRPLGRVVDGVELVLWPSPEFADMLGVTQEPDRGWLLERLTPHPWACFEQPLRLADPAALAAMPTYHVVCAATVPTRSRSLIAEARAAGRLWVIDTGHDLMITAPAETAAALAEAAA